VGAEEALTCFFDFIDRNGERPDSWREVYRALGAGEASEGRSLEPLQAAMRVGARVAWRRLTELAEQTTLPAGTLGLMGEAIFLYLDEIAAACTEGYAAAKASEAGELDRRRRRLLDLLLATPAAAPEAVAAAATAARWSLPRQLSAVVLDEHSLAAAPPPMLGPDLLVNLGRAEPCVILPDPDSASQMRTLVKGLGGCRAVAGPTVPPRDAAKSLRWARTALTFVQRGMLPDDGVLWCRDHLATLLVFGDEELLAMLAARRLAPLAGLPERSRDMLSHTLLAWLQFDRNAHEVAARLHVHPQTVRYRMRQVEQLFGDQLRDPDARLEMEIALRARTIAGPSGVTREPASRTGH
jgi:hypothetical protein